MKRLRIVCLALSVAIFTLWVFPALSYASITAYGLPASIFVLMGFIMWQTLVVRWPESATPFAIAFAVPIALVVLPLAISVPLHACLILAPTLLAAMIRRRFGKRHATTAG